MTTEGRLWTSRLRALLLGVPVALAAWGAILVGTTFAGSAGKPVAVFAPGGPEAALAAVVAAGGSIIAIGPASVIAIADDPTFVLRLYEQGPLLVVGASAPGCGFAAAARAGRAA